jgi:hypothetical protein
VCQRDSLRFLARAPMCTATQLSRLRSSFFFFFFSRHFTVNRARHGRRPVPPPIAKIEHLRHIGDTRLLFGSRIRRARCARKHTSWRDDRAIFFVIFLTSTTFGMIETPPLSLVDRAVPEERVSSTDQVQSSSKLISALQIKIRSVSDTNQR